MSNAAAGTRESAFWQFSLAFYARPGVADACLQLQDDAGVDVNVMFYVLFLATQRRQIDRTDAARVDSLVKKWRELAVSLRSAVKRIELDAERIEQEWLERHVPASTVGTQSISQVAAAQTNLAAYGALLTGLPDAPVATLLAAYAQYVGT